MPTVLCLDFDKQIKGDLSLLPDKGWPGAECTASSWHTGESVRHGDRATAIPVPMNCVSARRGLVERRSPGCMAQLRAGPDRMDNQMQYKTFFRKFAFPLFSFTGIGYRVE